MGSFIFCSQIEGAEEAELLSRKLAQVRSLLFYIFWEKVFCVQGVSGEAQGGSGYTTRPQNFVKIM